MQTNASRAIVSILATIQLLIFYSLPKVSADVPTDDVPPGSFEMMILLLLTIVGIMAVFALLRRAGIQWMRRGRK